MDKDIIELHLKSRVLDLIDDLMYATNDLDKRPNTNNAERVKALSYSISVLYPCIEDEREGRKKNEVESEGLPKRGTRKNR